MTSNDNNSQDPIKDPYKLAFSFAFSEARTILESKGFWPATSYDTVSFAGQCLTQEELAKLYYEKHCDRLISEAYRKLGQLN